MKACVRDRARQRGLTWGRTLRLRSGLWMVAMLSVVGCKKDAPPEQPKRIALNALGDDRVEFVPGDGQFPYCHIFTRSDSGVLRQLTMTQDNLSLPCPAGEPVGQVSFRVPVDEGPVTALVLFTDQQVNGASMGLQLLDLPTSQAPTAWNLRVPGRAVTEIIRFTPKASTAAPSAPSTTGAPVGSDGTPIKPAPDADAVAPASGDAAGEPSGEAAPPSAPAEAAAADETTQPAPSAAPTP